MERRAILCSERFSAPNVSLLRAFLCSGRFSVHTGAAGEILTAQLAVAISAACISSSSARPNCGTAGKSMRCEVIGPAMLGDSLCLLHGL